MSHEQRVKIVTHVPVADANAVREALGKSGAGAIGEYSWCSYSVLGKGRFMPSAQARPHIGTAGVLQTIDEECVEVVCARRDAKAAIRAIRAAHPYEEVALEVMALIEEEDI